MATINSFVLVKWLEEDSWDVLPLKNSVMPLESKHVVTEAIERGAVCQFYWKRGEESSPCVLLSLGKQKDLEKERVKIVEDSMTEQLSSDGELGVGRRRVKKPSRLEDLENDDPLPKQAPKKKPTVSSATNHDILKQLKQQQEADGVERLSTVCKCSKYSALKRKFAELGAENSRLEAKVNKYRGLYKDLKGNFNKRASDGAPTSPGEGVLPSMDQSPSAKASTDLVRQSSKVDIGHGVLLEKGQLSSILQGNDGATKLSRGLFSAVFRREEVIGRTLTGRKSNAHIGSLEKERLDPLRVSAVIDYTIKKYPGSSTSLIKQSLANKIKELNRRAPEADQL